MTTSRWPTHRIGAYAAVLVIGTVAALVLGRPEPALLAAPFGLYLAIGLALAAPGPPGHRSSVTASTARAIEGDEVDLVVHAPVGSEVRTVLPDGLAPVAWDGSAQRVRAMRWGAHRIGRVAVRTTDPLRLFVEESDVDQREVVRVQPSTTTLRRVVAPFELQRRVGDHTSRARGDGIEFADVRPFTRGDRARNVNWRATARRGGDLWVNERRPERNADVVLLLDTYGESRTHRRNALEEAVRALAAVASAFHDRRDRIGFLTFGGQLRWIPPGLGQRALVRIVDGLLDAEVLLTSMWDDTSRLPIGALPTHALLLAVTPLDNDPALHALLDLRARGFDIAVIVLPQPPAASARTDLGRRLAVLERDARRLRLERLGIAVATAARADDLTLAIEEVEQCRRRRPRVRA
jgi:uncharacterized protein (DUF58 family)